MVEGAQTRSVLQLDREHAPSRLRRYSANVLVLFVDLTTWPSTATASVDF